jgi:hypothetical protein
MSYENPPCGLVQKKVSDGFGYAPMRSGRLVTNSSPKLVQNGAFLWRVEGGKARQANDLG